jgi:hypothetical protein
MNYQYYFAPMGKTFDTAMAEIEAQETESSGLTTKNWKKRGINAHENPPAIYL